MVLSFEKNKGIAMLDESDLTEWGMRTLDDEVDSGKLQELHETLAKHRLLNPLKGKDTVEAPALPHVKVVFVFPGHPSSAEWFMRMMENLTTMISKGLTYAIAGAQGSNVIDVRNICLSRQGHRKIQKPFEDNLTYERMIWIDSDNIVQWSCIERLLSHDVDIVGGWCRARSKGSIDDMNFINAGYWNMKENVPGNRLRIQDVPNLPRDEKGLVEVDYLGFGLLSVKYGVFEALDYPWFRSWLYEWEEDGEKMIDCMSDDCGFCFRVKDLGYKIYMDPAIRIGHENPVVY